MEKAFLTKKDLETYLSISHGTVSKLMATRQIPFIKVGKKVLFRKADVDRWIESKIVR
jgi:excisionase family DNA binding protein